jgi:hypothetical protein
VRQQAPQAPQAPQRFDRSRFSGSAQGTIANSFAISFASRVVYEVTRRPRVQQKSTAADVPRPVFHPL